MLVDHYDEDWRQLWWVVVEGRAEVLDEGEEPARALELLAAKYPQYRVEPPRGAVIAVRIDRWRSWSAAS